MELRFSTRARLQLEAIKAYLREHDQGVADAVGRKIRAAAEMLREFPYLGHVGRLSGTRELVVPRLPYVIVYEVNVGDVDEIMILGIFHGAQDR
jgi:toxin ParE1/3/4